MSYSLVLLVFATLGETKSDPVVFGIAMEVEVVCFHFELVDPCKNLYIA